MLKLFLKLVLVMNVAYNNDHVMLNQLIQRNMLSVKQSSDLTHFCIFNWSWGVFPIYRKYTDVPI